jgi:uncharacterized protein
MEIDRTARRVLGSLIEKRWTTPDQYPLTLNSLVAACNQKSNRDPEMRLEEFIVDGCLRQLRFSELVMIVERDVGRTTRYAERLSEKLGLSRQEQAILAELMLRGPQSSTELYRRCLRMAQFQNAEEVEGLLHGMAPKGWTKLLPRESGQRHARWQHLFAPASETAEDVTVTAPVELTPLPYSSPTLPTSPTPLPTSSSATAAPAPAPPPRTEELSLLRAEVAALRAEIEALREEVLREPPPA